MQERDAKPGSFAELNQLGNGVRQGSIDPVRPPGGGLNECAGVRDRRIAVTPARPFQLVPLSPNRFNVPGGKQLG